jgi:hypothetical protein
MSHSTVLVIGPTNRPELEAALEPFNENEPVPRYLKYTKAQRIEEHRGLYKRLAERIEEYDKTEHPADPRGWAWKPTPELREEVANIAKMTDEQVFIKVSQYDHGDENIDPNGDEYSTYNPKSRWDWYQEGGRWSNMLKRDDGAVCNAAQWGEIVNKDEVQTFAVLKDGEWHEKGEMGWFGMVSDEKDTWPAEYQALVADLPDDTWVTVVDVHI